MATCDGEHPNSADTIHMNNALLFLGGLLIAALALLFAVPHFVDWNSYRGVLEEEASRVLGRDVRVGGGVNVRILPTPYVRFEKVRVADSGGTVGGAMIRIDSFTMWLSVAPLLQGILEANRIELNRPTLRLATNTEGGGNWQSLSVEPSAMPFMPTDVALQSVDVINGTIITLGASGNELTRIDAIEGELAADALHGPYRFKGKVNWQGTERKVRISTGKQDANGNLRLKANISSLESGNTYRLDGRIRSINTTPKLDGNLTAKLNLDVLSEARKLRKKKNADGKNVASERPEPRGRKKAATFDFRTGISGTTSSASLTDITITLDHIGAPQIITGNAAFDWSDQRALNVELTSKWLDLDAISGNDAKTIPLEAARNYFAILASALPTETETNAKLKFDQLTLGGDTIGNVTLGASRTTGPLELKGVRATLPGGTQLALDGELQPSGTVPKFDGRIFISGRSLLRFLSWGLRQPNFDQDRKDGPFSLDGRFALGEDEVELSEAIASWTGPPLRGGAKISFGKRNKLSVELEGAKINTREIGTPAALDLGAVSALLLPATGEKPSEQTPRGQTTLFAFDPKTSDLFVRLKVAELTDGVHKLNNLDAELALEDGNLFVPRLRFETPEGLVVEGDGKTRRQENKLAGDIRGNITAPTAETARQLAQLLAIKDEDQTIIPRLAKLTPFRLAGTVSLNDSKKKSSTEILIHGSALGGELRSSIRLAGKPAQWRNHPIDLTLSARGGNIHTLVAAALLSKQKGPTSDPTGRLDLKIAGTPKSGALTIASLTTDDISILYNGRLTASETELIQATGTAKINASNAHHILAMAGIPAASATKDVSLAGNVTIERNTDGLRLKSKKVGAGSTSLAGDVVISDGSDGQTKVEGNLSVDSVSVASLMSPMLNATPSVVTPNEVPTPEPANRSEPTNQQATTTDEAPGGLPSNAVIWPDQPFDLTALDNVEGLLKLNIKQLELEPGLALTNATFDANLSSKGISITNLNSEAVGGVLRGNATFKHATVGTELTGNISIDITSKQSAASDPKRTPGDVVAFSTEFRGRALSPQALISSLNGDGKVSIGQASVTGMSPSALQAVVVEGILGKGPTSGRGLQEAVAAAVKQGELELGSIAVPTKIRDGALELEEVRIDTKEGRARFTTNVDIATMKLQSEWKIGANLPKEVVASGELPPVNVIYSGKLSSLSKLTPTVTVDALERELQVRKMENDVAQLERLRKEDEARAKAERERRAAEEKRRAEERRLAEEARRKAEEERLRREAAERKQAEGATTNPPNTGTTTTTPDPTVSQPLESVGQTDPVEITDVPAPTDAPAPAGQQPGAQPGDPAAEDALTADGEAVDPEAPPPPQRVVRPKKKKPEPKPWNILSTPF